MYRFSLDPVLNHRCLLEDRLQKELAELEAGRQAAQNQLDRLERARRRSQEAVCGAAAVVRGDWLRVGEQYRRRLDREMETARERLAAAAAAVDAKRQELIEIVKGRKILEKLKERGQQAYRAAEARKEQNFLNEMAVTRFGR